MAYFDLPVDRGELHALGVMLAGDLYSAAPLGECGLLSLDGVFVNALAGETLTPKAALVMVVSDLEHLRSTGDLTDQTLARLGVDMARLVAYLEVRYGVEDIRAVGKEEVLAWINSSVPGGRSNPKVRTWRQRYWVVDKFFKTLRSLGLYDTDPLLDVPQPRTTSRSYRPLIDTEIEHARRHAARNRSDTRGPAAWALAEATATTSEIPEVTAADVDLARSMVWLTGGAKNVARWGWLTPFGVDAIGRHLVALGNAEPDVRLVFRGTGATSGQASSSKAIHEILRRSGLGSAPDVKPASVPAWAGVSCFMLTGDLETVRHLLGVRTLDRTRVIIRSPIGWSDVPPRHRIAS
jgi:site-specific recombinase XerD